jgi:hypothetical protein
VELLRRLRRKVTTRRSRYWSDGADPLTLSDMTSTYAYGTAHAVVMVGVFGSDGLTARQIGPAHATLGRANGRSRKALCGAYVGHDDQLPWPPEGYGADQLCTECATLAVL